MLNAIIVFYKLHTCEFNLNEYKKALVRFISKPLI